jgi:hypothetical protein
MSEKTFIRVNAIEELLKSIGIVCGPGYEQAWRNALHTLEMNGHHITPTPQLQLPFPKNV